MRSASRPLKPGYPVSTSRDSPDGDTINVAWPPSTSMNWMSSGFSGWATTVRVDPARAREASSRRNARMERKYNRRA